MPPTPLHIPPESGQQMGRKRGWVGLHWYISSFSFGPLVSESFPGISPCPLTGLRLRSPRKDPRQYESPCQYRDGGALLPLLLPPLPLPLLLLLLVLPEEKPVGYRQFHSVTSEARAVVDPARASPLLVHVLLPLLSLLSLQLLSLLLLLYTVSYQMVSSTLNMLKIILLLGLFALLFLWMRAPAD